MVTALDPQIECPTCCDRVGLNLATSNGQPRINTHKLARGKYAGEECPSSRTWVSQRMYDDAATRSKAATP